MPHQISNLPASFAALTVAMALAGCAVGPDFVRPASPSQTSYLPPQESEGKVIAVPVVVLGEGSSLRWWTVFNSLELDALVARAIAHNASLAASNATLAAAREQIAAARGRQLPQISADGRVEHEKVNLSAFGFDNGSFGSPEFTLYSLGGGVSYDFDLFGKQHRRIEQAAAQAEAQLRQTEAAHLTVVGQVVNQVLLIATVRARIDTANAVLADDQGNVDLAQKRNDAGEGTLVEVLNAQSQYQADRADIPQLGQQLLEARHLLATLIGVAPSDLGSTDIDLAALTLPDHIPVTLPSELVHQRPDILQAEADLHAAAARVGIATANIYPDITLGATFAQGPPSLGDVFRSAFRGFDLFAGLTAPIFRGGTLKAEKRAAVDGARAADANYRQTVLDALRQVADLLAAIYSDNHSVANQLEAVDVARRSLGLSRRSFEIGNSGIMQVLESERLYQRSSSNLVEARARQFQNVARLYVATAGGWSLHGRDSERRPHDQR